MAESDATRPPAPTGHRDTVKLMSLVAVGGRAGAGPAPAPAGRRRRLLRRRLRLRLTAPQRGPSGVSRVGATPAIERQQGDDRLGVGDAAVVDHRQRVVERHPGDHHVLLLDALAVVGHLGEPGRHVDHHRLVARSPASCGT